MGNIIYLLFIFTCTIHASYGTVQSCYEVFTTISHTSLQRADCEKGTFQYRIESTGQFSESEMIQIIEKVEGEEFVQFAKELDCTSTNPSDPTTKNVPAASSLLGEAECPFVVVSTSNTIITAHNTLQFTKPWSCWISIRPPNSLSRVSLTFTSFYVPSSPNCTAGSVQIFGSLHSPPLCGVDFPEEVISDGNIMEIHYTSHSDNTVVAFEALVKFLDPDPEYRAPGPVICDSIYLDTNTSVNVRSPTFPNTRYRNIRCGYVIHADIGKVISMRVAWIYIEVCSSREDNEDNISYDISAYDIPEVILAEADPNGPGDVACPCDSLQAFDGANRQAPPFTDRLCGFDEPGTFVSSGNIVYLYFETDDHLRLGGFEVNFYV